MAVNVLGWVPWTDPETKDLTVQLSNVQARIAKLQKRADEQARNLASQVKDLESLAKKLKDSLADKGEWAPIRCNATVEAGMINYYSVKDGHLVWSEPMPT